ncbi:hypothetical protein QJQ45_017698 [Haematococcus lacustris]|nr:hypothetical protein QJQ45_017698 [Haematococcus lacustris]
MAGPSGFMVAFAMGFMVPNSRAFAPFHHIDGVPGDICSSLIITAAAALLQDTQQGLPSPIYPPPAPPHPPGLGPAARAEGRTDAAGGWGGSGAGGAMEGGDRRGLHLPSSPAPLQQLPKPAIFHAATSSLQPICHLEVGQLGYDFFRKNPPRFKFARYHDFHPDDSPPGWKLNFSKAWTGFKVKCAAKLLGCLGHQGEARRLVNGFAMFDQEMDPKNDFSLVFSVKNALFLEARLVEAERAEFPVVWRGSWTDYAQTYMNQQATALLNRCMAQFSPHRPALAWYSDLSKAKNDGLVGLKARATIQDLLERINDPNADEQALVPSSPRSVEACFRLGLDPHDLQYHPVKWYAKKEDVDGDVTHARFERFEYVRQERLRALIEQRKQLVDEGWQPADQRGFQGLGTSTLRREASGGNAASSSMVEQEKQRLEVLKRRQEKDLQQLVNHELSRKELAERQQRKVEELERRNQELQRQRLEQEAARSAKQREIELLKAAEEQELLRKARLQAEERNQWVAKAHDRRMAAEKAEQEKAMKRKAAQDDLERRQKAEEARRQTDAILAAQAEEVRLRRLDMDKRDAEREKRLQQELKQRTLANIEKRKKADLRIQSALDQNAQLVQQKRSTFMAREAEAAVRRKELEEIRLRQEEQKRQEELRRERDRHDKYMSAVEMEAQRRASIKARAEEKERMLSELYEKRRKENDLKRVEQDFQLKLRLDKVDAMQKTSLYQRQELLAKILQEYEKTRSLMRDRTELQRQRKMTNMQSSMQRQAISQVMDALKSSKGMRVLAQGGGQININQLLGSVRPSTAY